MLRGFVLTTILTCVGAVALLAGTATAAAGATLPGDVNGDCQVNVIDLRLVGQRYGHARGSLLYGAAYDLNGDGQINIIDLQIVASHFGTTC